MPLPPLPNAFKPIKPFLARAEELDRDASREECQVVAYFCRQYAMERGLQLRAQDTSVASTEFLTALMAQLETDKRQLAATPTVEEGKAIVTRFTMDVFERADQEDRAELADKGTARTFYAAAIFFEVLKQFGEVHPDLEQKRMYAKWKSAEIVNALKAGVPVTPGGPGEAPAPARGAAVPPDGPDAASATSPMLPSLVTPSLDGPIAPTAPTTPSSLPAATQPETPPVQPIGPCSQPEISGGSRHSPVPPPIDPAPSSVYPTPSREPVRLDSAGSANGAATADKLKDAIELAKFAIRSLEHKQVGLGVERLQQALAVLQRH